MFASRPSRRAALLMLAGAGLAGCASSQGNNLWGVMTPADMGGRTPPDPASATFQLGRFTGGPGNTLDTLRGDIERAAARADLTLVGRTDPSPTYRVNAHLTAIGSDQGTTVTYVVDVIDGSGTRVYRFTGGEPSGDSEGDPWAGVTHATLSIIAERTVETLRAWLHGAIRR